MPPPTFGGDRETRLFPVEEELHVLPIQVKDAVDVVIKKDMPLHIHPISGSKKSFLLLSSISAQI